MVTSARDKEKAKLTFSTSGTSSHQLRGENKRECMGWSVRFRAVGKAVYRVNLYYRH